MKISDLFWRQTFCLKTEKEFDLEKELQKIVSFGYDGGNQLSSFCLYNVISEKEFKIGQIQSRSTTIFKIQKKKDKLLIFKTNRDFLGYLYFLFPLFLLLIGGIIGSVFSTLFIYFLILLDINESKGRLIREFKKHGFTEVEEEC